MERFGLPVDQGRIRGSSTRGIRSVMASNTKALCVQMASLNLLLDPLRARPMISRWLGTPEWRKTFVECVMVIHSSFCMVIRHTDDYGALWVLMQEVKA